VDLARAGRKFRHSPGHEDPQGSDRYLSGTIPRVIMRLGAAIVLVLLWCPVAALAQSGLLYRVSLDARMSESTAVFEGRVVDQESFWNSEGSRIYTVHTIRVYRSFAGDARPAEWQIVTEGGIVGLAAQIVQPGLTLAPGDVGLFFAEESRLSREAARPVILEPYAGRQGFIRYDEILGTASDPFDVYRDIRNELYAPLAARFGPPREHATYRTPSSVAASPGGKASLAPAISDFAPATATAGTGTILTISGSGFETYDGGNTSQVFFPEADDGGRSLFPTSAAEIVSWTESQIQVRIPSRAGSGTFRVRSASGLQASSSLPIDIRYSIGTIEHQGRVLRPSLRNRNGSGGYSLKLSTSTANSGVDFAASEAAAAFIRALTTWQLSTGFNVKTNGGAINDATVAPGDDNDIVMFDADDDDRLDAGTLGKTYLGFRSCNGTDWWVAGMDLRFRRDGTGRIDWNYGPAGTGPGSYDFESVALHEIGHSHQLGHVISGGALMHWQFPGGEDIRVLDPDTDVEGGLFVMEASASLNACGETGMTPIGDREDDDRMRPGLSAPFPNPVSNEARLILRAAEMDHVTVEMFDLLGRRVHRWFQGFVDEQSDHIVLVDGRNYASGVYIAVARGETFTSTRKVVVVH